MPDNLPDAADPADDTLMVLPRMAGGEPIDDDPEAAGADEESLFARDPFGRLIRVDRPTEADLNKLVRLKVDGSDWFEVPKAVPATDAQGNVRYNPDGSTVVRATTIYDAVRLLTPPDPSNPAPPTRRAAGSLPPGGPPAVAGAGDGRIELPRIPVLCHQDHLNPVAVCRACVVQIVLSVPDPKNPGQSAPKAQRKLLPACQHRVEEGMEVHTMWTPTESKYRKAVRSSVQVLYELLAGDHCHPDRDAALRHRDQKYRNELDDLRETLAASWSAYKYDAHVNPAEPERLADPKRFRFAPKPANDDLLVGWVDGLPDTAAGGTVSADDVEAIVSAPPFVVDHNNCILCDRCIRACGEVKPFDVIGRSGKGATTQIAFDLRALPMAQSSCRACGECMTACPTGAISFQYRVMDPSPTRLAEVADRHAVPVDADELLRHPLFGRMSKAFLEWNRGAVRRRQVRAGDVIAAEGEYGTTAFIVEEGYVGVFRKGATPSPALPHLDKPGVADGLKRVGSRYGAALFVQEADPDDPVGEMAPMSHARRNATLVAVTPGRVMEIDRNVLFVLLRDPQNREKLDRLYAQRALFEILPRLARPGTAGLFSVLTADEVRALTGFVAPAAQVVRAQPNYVICREGESADDFYLIRLGFVGLSAVKAGGWLRAPLKQGDCFGEVALLTRLWPAAEANRLPAHVARGIRTATCTALDHAELVRVPGERFEQYLKKHPDTFAKLRDQCVRQYGGK